MQKNLTETQYKALLTLYHEFSEAFDCLSDEIRGLFFKRVYQGQQTHVCKNGKVLRALPAKAA